MSLLGGSDEAPIRCSAAGCRDEAAWAVNWRNPRIHGLDRVKVWLACPDHRDRLSGYLETRGFPVVVTEVGTPVEAVP